LPDAYQPSEEPLIWTLARREAMRAAFFHRSLAGCSFFGPIYERPVRSCSRTGCYACMKRVNTAKDTVILNLSVELSEPTGSQTETSVSNLFLEL